MANPQQHSGSSGDRPLRGHDFFEQLLKESVPPGQATVFVDFYYKFVNENYATKADLEEIEVQLTGTIDTLRKDLVATETRINEKFSAVNGRFITVESSLRKDIQLSEMRLENKITEMIIRSSTIS